VKTRNMVDERRAANRFPIERQIHFKAIGKRKIAECGLGQTINISSTGVLFTTDQFLSPGRRLEVAISWPAQLDASVGLQLVAQGRIVRSDQGTAALEIQHYEFRTCSRHAWNSPIVSRRLPQASDEQPAVPAAIA
jgi:hypothetical protein